MPVLMDDSTDGSVHLSAMHYGFEICNLDLRFQPALLPLSVSPESLT